MTISNPSNRWFNDVRADYRVHRDKAVTCKDYDLTISELNEILSAPSYVRYLELRQRQTEAARRLHSHPVGGKREANSAARPDLKR